MVLGDDPIEPAINHSKVINATKGVEQIQEEYLEEDIEEEDPMSSPVL